MTTLSTTLMLTVEELPLVFPDTTPIPQDDGPHPVCRIDYKKDFVIAYDYLRAILKADERSERALRLTALCLQLNPANYSVWHFRRLCLRAVGLTEERVYQDLDLAADLGGSNPKNYQIAFHRRALLEALGLDEGRARRELQYIAGVLEEDGKNYHMWSSRQWIIRTVDSDRLWSDELDYVNELIVRDCRNNSAWNQRWYVVHRGDNKLVLSEEIARREVDYALEIARLDPYNESPWRYLIGIVKKQKLNSPVALDYCLEQTTDFGLQVLLPAERDPTACASLNSARIDLLELKGSTEALQNAMQLAKDMATQHDVIRRKYWNLRVSEMENKMSNIMAD
jgi:protein farnesyltransferase/geranylgeranyltransferase type-1 subunit alpha